VRFDAVYVGHFKCNLRRIELREQIDALNARIYTTVNNGVYKAGFATSEIIRMMNSAFDRVGASPGDFYPVVGTLGERACRSRCREVRP
jgi:glutathionyl-hydroquinone reductase